MAKKRKKRIASRGSVNNIILKSLIEGDKYGYEIIKDVETYSSGKIKLKQPSLYSSLSRFEDKGYVSSYWGDSDIGGRRHYYHLTDAGIAYYQRAVLKITDEEDEIDEIDEAEENSLSSISNDPIEYKEVENDTEIIEDSPHNSDNMIATEVDENEIPAIVDFPDKIDEEEPVFDHHFYTNTPMEKSIFENESHIETQTNTASPIINDSPWLVLSEPVKANNRRVVNTSNRRFHYLIPKKEKKVILDKDGIYKLRDADYVPSHHREPKPKIIDNVIKRTKDSNIYGYPEYADKANSSKTSYEPELTEEEKRRKNELFVAKFNSLTRSKYDDDKNKDYQDKLNALLNSSNIEEPVEETVQYTPPTPVLYDDTTTYNDSTNNLFNYTNDEIEEESDVVFDNNIDEDEDDRFIDFDPEEFETKNENKQYIDEISNYTAPTENVKVSRYVNNTQAILQDKSYVLINKVNCIFGFILAFILFAELTISFFIFKKYGLITDGDNGLYIVSYICVTLLALCYILPILFNSNEHKLNTFKLKYAMIFGILTFLVCAILVYCFNALFGFQLDNIEFYAVKLTVPCLLAFNFIILPPIYASLIKCKKFYD